MSEPTPPAQEAIAPAPPRDAPRCANCGTTLLGPTCHACGQPVKGLIRPFSSILGDFLDTVLSIDSRTPRTILPLYLKPGFLSNEYFAGRRVRYVTPLRMYFFLSVVVFLVISFLTLSGDKKPPIHFGKDDEAMRLAAMTPAEREQRLAELEKKFAFLPAERRLEVRAELEKEVEAAQKKAQAREAAKKDGKPALDEDDDDDEELHVNGKPWDAKTNPLTFDWLSASMNDALNAEITELIRKGKELNKDPTPFLKQLFSVAPQALFVILPLFALLLKIFYVFKRRLYMEHLIVALHSHSFICLSMLVVIFLSKLRGWSENLPGLPPVLLLAQIVACCWIPLYIFLMQKRVYRQGWILTTLKFTVIGSLYMVLLVFAMLATMLVSLVLL